MEITLSSSIDVELIDHMGSDDRIVAAAKVSTRGTHSTDEANAGLINYLMVNRHGTPFEHASMTFKIDAPIFVFREWHRHRVGWSYNEESGRYKELAPKFYSPPTHRELAQEGKPGHYRYVPGTDVQRDVVKTSHNFIYAQAYTEYRHQLDQGVCREVARMVLPVSIYSSMYATCNPRSLMHFLALRTKSARAKVKSSPMHEINVAATQMETSFAQLFPITHDAWHRNGRVAP
jgi:thymidylate synthase (FAD)